MKKYLKSLFAVAMFLVFFGLLSSNILRNCEVSAAYDFASEINASWTNNYKGDKLNNATQNVVGTIVNTIRIVGTGISIIMITYVAIKYMSAAPSEKAEFKKSAMAFIVGAVVLFASSQILGVIANFATSNIEGTKVITGSISEAKRYIL